MSKLTKITIWKNLIALLIIFIVISLIFIFNVKIGFSIFENIKSVDIILLLSVFLTVLTIVFVIIGYNICNLQKKN